MRCSACRAAYGVISASIKRVCNGHDRCDRRRPQAHLTILCVDGSQVSQDRTRIFVVS